MRTLPACEKKLTPHPRSSGRAGGRPRRYSDRTFLAIPSFRYPMLGVAAAALLAGCGGGTGSSSPQQAAHMRVSSPAFINNARLPKKYTCDGEGNEPVVKVGTVP